MKYHSGQDVEIGDTVDLGGQMTGRVVILFKEKKFDKRFPADYWGELEDGMMIESPEAGLIHYPEMGDARLLLLRRE